MTPQKTRFKCGVCCLTLGTELKLYCVSMLATSLVYASQETLRFAVKLKLVGHHHDTIKKNNFLDLE